jgi:hypothetical protein
MVGNDGIGVLSTPCQELRTTGEGEEYEPVTWRESVADGR